MLLPLLGIIAAEREIVVKRRHAKETPKKKHKKIVHDFESLCSLCVSSRHSSLLVALASCQQCVVLFSLPETKNRSTQKTHRKVKAQKRHTPKKKQISWFIKERKRNKKKFANEARDAKELLVKVVPSCALVVNVALCRCTATTTTSFHTCESKLARLPLFFLFSIRYYIFRVCVFFFRCISYGS